MSEHTEGRIEAFTEPEFSGWWALRQITDDGLNHEIGSGDGGLFEPDARRLAACWNMFLDIDTDVIEIMPTFVEFQQANEQTLHETLCELNAARSLLREVTESASAIGLSIESENINLGDWWFRVKSYLDACDTLEGK